MSIINNILDLALKKSINAIDPNNYGDSNLNALSNRVTTALAGVPANAISGPSYNNITVPHATGMMQNPIATITVGDSTTYCTGLAGACCLWTVPAGVTQAQFQIWGAGGNGTGCCSGSCCQFGPMGSNGEYTYLWTTVQPGQTYTLCAGGANPTGGCYNYCMCNGCNSFVCGSNSTCILSCGGEAGYCIHSCGYSQTLFPQTFPQGWWQTGGDTSMQCYVSLCYNQWAQPSQRYDGTIVGGWTTTNKVKAAAKTGSWIGSVHKCDQTEYGNICMKSGPVVMPDHTITNATTNWCGYRIGCGWDGCSAWNFPGVGGPGANFMCNYSSAYGPGGRGRSGLVIVKYC